MSKNVKRTRWQTKSVEITLKIWGKNKYEVEIFIPDAITEMKIKNKLFYLRLKSTGNKESYSPVTITLKGSYRKDNRLAQVYDYVKLTFCEKGYTGAITLSPKFYIPSKVREKN